MGQHRHPPAAKYQRRLKTRNRHSGQTPHLVLKNQGLCTITLRLWDGCETFTPEKARDLCERFEIHHTPKHGSWLNMAEIEIGVLGTSCLNRRISSPEEFRGEVKAYVKSKNAASKPINWQFTNEKARIKLKSLYPSI